MRQDYKLLYAAKSNSDLTEGRGYSVYYLGETRSTAERLGKYKGVQGYDCEVVEIYLTKICNQWHIPLNYVTVCPASIDDLEKEKERLVKIKEENIRKGLVQKLNGIELTEEEIDLLISSKVLNAGFDGYL